METGSREHLEAGVTALEDYFLSILGKKRGLGLASFTQGTVDEDLRVRLFNLSYALNNMSAGVVHCLFWKNFATTQTVRDISKVCLKEINGLVSRLHA